MNAARLPVSAISSVLLHGAFILAYLQVSQTAKKDSLRVISNVDLLIQVHKPGVPPAAKAPAVPSTWNFLKMALPSLPKPEAALQQMATQLPAKRKPLLMETEKLEDKGKRETKAKLDALDLGRRRVEAAKVSDSFIARKPPAAMAQLPRLEEVGTRRVRNLPAAIALEEVRREENLKKIEQSLGPARQAPLAAMPVLREATPPERARLGDKMPAFLPQPERLILRPAEPTTPAPAVKKPVMDMAPPSEPRRPAKVLEAASKKAVEIEGPLADRKIVSYELPEFPAWARDQGVLEAVVSIHFTVSPEGRVLPGMRVESTSGYGRIDRLAMDSLKKWRFIPLEGTGSQWGIIFFRFVME